ncbi:MAG: energy transducer TonB [Prevotella sp.]|nr:energy transducer TonB [Prevotella sp.]
MSKIDLFDQKWIDLVFEGKNEAYGAYKMRQDTNNRNLMAMISLILGIAAIVGIVFLWGFAKNNVFAGDDDVNDNAVEVAGDLMEEPEPEEEEVPDIPLEEPEPQPELEEVLQEELVTTEKYTDLAMDDEKQEEPVKTAADAAQSGEATGVENVIGSEEGNVRMTEEKQIVEEKHEVVEQEIFNVVEQPPTFPEGDVRAWVAKNLKYPPIAEENNIQGQVVCQFVVEPDGSISHVTVARGVDKSLNEEAVRVIKKMPKWIPGKQNGRAVRVRYTLPVKFVLSN